MRRNLSDEIRDHIPDELKDIHVPDGGGFWAKSFVLLVVLCIGAGVFYFSCVNHIAVNEMGGWYDMTNGNIWTNDRPGWYVTPPWVREITVDLRPRKISITSDARLVNAKLVRFKREGFVEYVKLQGFEAPADDVMLGYAYSGRQFPFLDIMEEPDKNGTQAAGK